VDLDALRRKIANYVGAKALPMVKTATDEAVKVGNLQSLKYLFELIGLHPAEGAGSTEPEVGNDLSALLLKQLGLGPVADEVEQADIAVKAESGSDPVE
jgi:hypothetical protein